MLLHALRPLVPAFTGVQEEHFKAKVAKNFPTRALRSATRHRLSGRTGSCPNKKYKDLLVRTCKNKVYHFLQISRCLCEATLFIYILLNFIGTALHAQVYSKFHVKKIGNLSCSFKCKKHRVWVTKKQDVSSIRNSVSTCRCECIYTGLFSQEG